MKVVIPAAGSGVRFHELGRQYPKCTLPFNEKPIIVHNINTILKMPNVEDITIVLGHKSQSIRDVMDTYFPNEVKLGKIKFSVCYEIGGNVGPAVSIFNGMKPIKTPLLIVLSDIYIDDTITDFSKSWISVKKVPDWERWCMVKKVSKDIVFIDKPKEKPDTDLSISGLYYIKDMDSLYKIINKKLHETYNKEYDISPFLDEYQKIDKFELKEVSIIDFGTLEDYNQNRNIRKERSFNNVKFEDYKVTKGSHESKAKIINEFNWYRTMPNNIQRYLPRIYDSNITQDVSHDIWYSMENIKNPTLREWYLFLESDTSFWNTVFDSIFSVLDLFQESHQFGKDFFKFVALKNRQRISELSPEFRDESFIITFENALKKVNIPNDSLFHGDMCLPNIFFDPRTNGLTLIDPRGDISGNILYDYAKLMQCFIYNYDFIDAELYVNEGDKYRLFNAGKENIQELFMNKLRERFDEKTINFIRLITASLFITMIPLHTHNKTNQKLYYECYKKARADSGF